jgi:hypothetical protein
VILKPRRNWIEKATGVDHFMCYYCLRSRDDHMNRKCLFGSGEFAETHSLEWRNDPGKWTYKYPASPLVWMGPK